MSLFKKIFGGKGGAYKAGKLDLNHPTPLCEVFADANLAHCVLNALNKRSGRKLSGVSDAVTIEDLKEIRTLKASGMEIRSLEGMEYLIKLHEVDLSHNLIEKIPYNIEDLTRINNKYKGGFTLNLFAYVMDLSDNRFGEIPDFVSQYRDKERNLFIDLSNNPVIDPEIKLPSIEGSTEVIKANAKEPLTDAELYWLLYYVNAYYLVKNSIAISGFTEKTPGDFIKEDTAFYKDNDSGLGINIYRDTDIQRHQSSLVNDRGHAAICVKQTERQSIEKIVDYKLCNGLIPEDEAEPFNQIKPGETVNLKAITTYYSNNTDKLCPELFPKDILSDNLTPEKKSQLEQKQMIKEALGQIEGAIQSTDNTEATQKLKTIAALIQTIAAHKEQQTQGAPVDFSFEVNYLPMTLSIVTKYQALNQASSTDENSQRSKAKIEKSFDTIIEAFTNYTKQFDQSSTLDLYSDVDALTSLFESHGLTKK